MNDYLVELCLYWPVSSVIKCIAIDAEGVGSIPG